MKRTRQLASHNVKPAAKLLQLRSIPAVGEERADTGGCVMCGYHALRSECASGTRAWWSSPRSIRDWCDSRESSERCELHRHANGLPASTTNRAEPGIPLRGNGVVAAVRFGRTRAREADTQSREDTRRLESHRESPMLSRRLLRYKPSHVLHTRGYLARSH